MTSLDLPSVCSASTLGPVVRSVAPKEPSGTASRLGDSIILYDGVCGICNRFVRFILKRDARGEFLFAPLQGGFAHSLLEREGKCPDALETVYLVTNHGEPEQSIEAKGRAALAILARLGPPWSFLSVFRIVPRPLLDCVYDLIAKNRYRLHRKLDACPVPPPEWRARFISDDAAP